MPIAPEGSGADQLAQTLFSALSQDYTFSLPDVDLSGGAYVLPDRATNTLYTDVTPLDNTDLTTRTPGGTGTFDALMETNRAHLREEFDKGRITGSQFAEAYISLTTAALGSAVQYLLGKDQAYWAAVQTQMQARRAEIEAVTAGVQLESAKAELARMRVQLETEKANYALTKMKIASEDIQFDLLESQTAKSEYEVSDILPAQKAGIDKDNSVKDYQISTMLPAQKKLVDEQIEVQRAQTKDTRTDNSTIAGSVGKQKQLYDQQIDSYKKDAEYKVGKMYLDTYITHATLDPNGTVPSALTDTNISSVLGKLRTNNNL